MTRIRLIWQSTGIMRFMIYFFSQQHTHPPSHPLHISPHLTMVLIIIDSSVFIAVVLAFLGGDFFLLLTDGIHNNHDKVHNSEFGKYPWDNTEICVHLFLYSPIAILESVL